MRPSTEGPWSLTLGLGLLDRLVPRLLSQIDRDPDSPTFGSCDRGFWMYRLHDFDSGVLQQASLSLAGLSLLVREADLSDRLPTLRAIDPDYFDRLALAVNLRTVKLLERDGFLDEYYPGEQSYPSTVFAAYAVLKSAALLGHAQVLGHAGLRATAQRLLGRQPSPAANQDVAAAAFLGLYSKTHGWQREAALRTVQGLLAGADGAGRLLEYGGGDLGYSTVSAHYLACMLDDDSFDVGVQLDDVAAFVADFVSPSGQLGGEYASRSTTYWLPFGLTYAARRHAALAGQLARLDLRSTFDRLDDRYLMHYCLPSLIMTALGVVREGAPSIHLARRSGWRVCDHRSRGLLAVHGDDASLFVGLAKGGSFTLEVQGATVKPPVVDAGYRVSHGESVYASCVVDPEPRVQVDDGAQVLEIGVRCGFHRYRSLTASPNKTVALRLARGLGSNLNTYFKDRLIKRAETLDGPLLVRTFRLDRAAKTLNVDDEITGLDPRDRLSIAPPVSLRLVPSARFWQPGEAKALHRVGPAESRTHRRYAL